MTELAPTGLERVLRYDRRIVLMSVVMLTALCWAYLVVISKQMAEGDMSLMGMGDMSSMSVSEGEAGGMAMASGDDVTDMSISSGTGTSMNMADPLMLMIAPWTGTTFLLMFMMWWVMMTGMMVPSAAPMILLFALVHRKTLADMNPLLHTTMFTLGYLLTWGVFSAVATALQWWLTEALLLSAVMVSTSKWLGSGLLVAAGIYQLTPLKGACLRHCRSPIHFLSTHWRKGIVGSLRMGVEHGAFCVGCCWFLMALLFVGGVMNLIWVAAIAIFVLVEKVVPRGDLVGKASGVAMLGVAAYLAA